MKGVVKVLVLFISIFISNFSLNGYWVLNDPPPNVGGGGEKTEADEIVDFQINLFIIEGASNFLQSQSSFLLLINESESSAAYGFNLDMAKEAVGKALAHIITSGEKYSLAMDLMKGVVFDPQAIDRLKNFNYSSYASTHHLHADVMERVASYLSEGNVIGVYKAALDDFEGINNSLYLIQGSIDGSMIPPMSELRKLYQQYSDTMLFGYYASLLFHEIK